MSKGKADTVTGRLTAHNAEAAVLGSVLLDSSIMGWLKLSEEHFSHPMHIRIYRAMAKLYEEDGPIDEIALEDALGPGSGVDLADISRIAISTPTADNAEYWVKILEEHRRLRSLSRSVSEAQKYLTEAGTQTSDEIVDELLRDLAELNTVEESDSITMAEAADAELARMETQWEGGDAHPRIKLGVDRLDKEIGGCPIGVLTALGARPGVGKSTMLWNFCNYRASLGENVIVFTNEDKPNVGARLGLANATGIERIRLLNGDVNAEEKFKIRQAVERMRQVNERYHVVKIHGKKMREICREAKALIRRYSVKFVALDYIQNVPNPDRNMTRNYGIEENLTHLEAMVAEEDIAMMMIGQIKRIEDNRRPQMDDFKDSGSIEQKCKLMMILSDGEYNTMDIDIVKNSEGRMGGTVNIDIDKGLGRVG